jgi:hypothetical protein
MTTSDLNKTLSGKREIELEVIGRVTGKRIRLPVWFTHDARHVYLVPVHGSDSQWFKNVLKTPRLSLRLGNILVEGDGHSIREAGQVGQVVEAFRAKYGPANIKRYYSKLNAAVEVRPAARAR